MKQEKESLKISKNLPLIIGTFDVLHKGHEKLFNQVKPNKFNVILIINSPSKKEWISQLLVRYGNIKFLHPKKIYFFDVKQNNVSAINFIKHYLKILSPSKIIVGSDFRFGKNQSGDVKLLKKYFNVQSIKYDHKYQTNKIKKLYKEGRVLEANKLLYSPIILYEDVKSCKHKGTKLGFPTLNIIPDKNHFIFKEGTYASLCRLANHKTYYGATCIYNENGKQIIETHIIKDFPKLYKRYNKKIFISFIEYIMPFKKISNEENLIRYIEASVNAVKKFFGIRL